jgi:hypothetical protein
LDPHERVADLEPGEPDRDAAEVDGARSEEGEEMPAWFEDAVAFAPHRRAGDERVPRAAHESAAAMLVVVAGEPVAEDLGDVRFGAEPVRRIRHARVHGRVGEFAHPVDAVAGEDLP